MTNLPGTLSAFRPVAAAVLDAGRAILEVYGRDFAVDYKDDRSPLTAADRAAHDILQAALGELPERLPVLSEESAAAPYETRRKWSRFWLVDPLDGTKEFVKRNGEFTVNVALIDHGRPEFGAVYAPVPGTLYLGLAGVGAYRFDRAAEIPDLAAALENPAAHGGRRLPLAASETGRAGLRVVASRSHRNPETQALIEALEARHGPLELVSIGSSLKLCLVAEGTADLYPRLAPTMEWDTAAAQAVVEAAGGSVSAYGGNAPLRYNKPELLNPYFVVAGPNRQALAAGVADGNV
jgi:3'(2'), 5'-bisphosphate nucleotidase